MTGKPARNIAASVHQRLLNRARETSRPFNELLQYFAMERFLYRLSQSPHADRFVLKGALMLNVWQAPSSRPTMDIDLLGAASNDLESMAAMVRDVCAQSVEADGLEFDSDTVVAERIIEDAEYGGVRVRLRGNLGNARVLLHIDVGFGDPVVPEPSVVSYPTLLDLPAPTVKGYTMESTIAEKLHTMVKHGELNSRMKDFYDVWLLSQHYDFNGAVLSRSIAETFSSRETEVPSRPTGVTDSFAQSESKVRQWGAFLRRHRIDDAPSAFPDVVAQIAEFLVPITTALAAGEPFGGVWDAPGPWSGQVDE